ncbi:U4/U6 small nuclear ribonucleoprotein Prp31 [Gossypium australe]|uniref:U4/U6 small nuclear ribonucleoprotein Prp31 n=1 Tax=Gossypium australe TaxID=47621 RepID=A0A5B6VC26_9ROSI|nr:U4/U6 small nuclear ribonucleoprotein Prp31 [Gossypium australe]
MNSHWWGSKGNVRKIHWASWNKLCAPKKLGGMGFSILHCFNLAMMRVVRKHLRTVSLNVMWTQQRFPPRTRPVLLALSRHFQGVMDAHVAEAIIMCKALSWIKDPNGDKVINELDCIEGFGNPSLAPLSTSHCRPPSSPTAPPSPRVPLVSTIHVPHDLQEQTKQQQSRRQQRIDFVYLCDFRPPYTVAGGDDRRTKPSPEEGPAERKGEGGAFFYVNCTNEKKKGKI